MKNELSPIAWLNLQNHVDDRGLLRVVDLEEIPFTPRRFFSITVSAINQERGGHSHIECWQMLFCVAGDIEVHVSIDESISIFRLSENGPGLVIPPGYWSKQVFQNPSSVLGVMASHPYDPNDYIYEIPSAYK